MKQTKATLLFHPLFLLSLVVLFVNDLYWKYEYHNWLTGKLSDFAGMIVLPVFLNVFFRMRKIVCIIFSALFLIWWKTSLAEPVILFCNQCLSIPVGRVVDYTDLWALIVLLFAGWMKPVCMKARVPLQAWCRWSVGLLTVVSLCSTSAPYRYSYFGGRGNEVSFYEDFKSNKTADELLDALKTKGFAVRREQERYYPFASEDNLYYRVPGGRDSTVQWVPVPHAKDSAIYLRRTAYKPFYVIPVYVIESDTLRNLEFTIQTNDKKKRNKTIISIETFQAAKAEKYRDFYTGNLRKQYKKNFEKFFAEL